MRRKKPDYIAQLIEISDKCLTMDGPIVKKNGAWADRPCNCRANIKKILRKMGFKPNEL